MTNITDLSIRTIRYLGVDQINAADSGHPGIVLGAAPMMYSLYALHMNVNPRVSNWINRDRFILAAGHGSALLYSMLHLCGYQVSIDDLKSFRQIYSKTPGHPEVFHTDGVDATSGPLGQGIAMGVGMALAEAHLGAKFNTDKHAVIDHYTYVLCGDGDLMEGVTSEASSLAGHLGLGKLVVLYDSNDICLDGKTNKSFTENVRLRYEAYGWHTVLVEDGNDVNQINEAISEAKKVTDKPSLIEVKTIIGHGSKLQGTNKVHGSPIGKEEASRMKLAANWSHPEFHVENEVYEHFNEVCVNRGEASYETWQNMLNEYKAQYPELYQEFNAYITNDFTVNLDEVLSNYTFKNSVATRNSSADVLNLFAKTHVNLIGGAADLTASTKTYLTGQGDFSKDNLLGKNIFFGVREFAMGTIMNGISLHGGLKVFGSTFLVFSDYVKPAIRMAALMKLPVVYVFTHDSIAVGEDGPTHEPIEQLTMLRSIPNVNVYRPSTDKEVLGAWKQALEYNEGPSIMILTRQNLPFIESTSVEGTLKGGYVVSSEENQCDGIIMASGSELELALKVKENLLNNHKMDLRVVSMVNINAFNAQTREYKESVLPNTCVNRFAIELSNAVDYYRYVGLNGVVFNLEEFGLSGKYEEVLKHFRFTVEEISKEILYRVNK